MMYFFNHMKAMCLHGISPVKDQLSGVIHLSLSEFPFLPVNLLSVV